MKQHHTTRARQYRASNGLPTVALAAVLSLIGCNSADEDASGACFPVPNVGAIVVREMPASHGVTSALGATRPDHETQGRELQGVGLQGLGMQGLGMQGIGFQGFGPQGANLNGKGPNGRAWRRTLNLHHMNGVRLELANTRGALGLSDGALVADGFVDTDALRDTQLVGTATDGAQFPVEIVTVERVQNIDRIQILIDGEPACDPGDDGLFVEGAWNERGEHVAMNGALTYSCMSGVIAKCVNWGYAPWNVGSEMHQTCTRMARADYCGDGNSWTMNGTLIDIYDAIGVQTSAQDPELSFEAAWSANGATCVNDLRYVITDATGDQVQPSCLAALPTCSSLAEAQELGAVLVNGSAHALIAACE